MKWLTEEAKRRGLTPTRPQNLIQQLKKSSEPTFFVLQCSFWLLSRSAQSLEHITSSHESCTVSVLFTCFSFSFVTHLSFYGHFVMVSYWMSYCAGIFSLFFSNSPVTELRFFFFFCLFVFFLVACRCIMATFQISVLIRMAYYITLLISLPVAFHDMVINTIVLYSSLS